MFYPTNKLRGALHRLSFESTRYAAAGELPDVLIDELVELAVFMAMVEPGMVS